jgi:hypothetical protein
VAFLGRFQVSHSAIKLGFHCRCTAPCRDHPRQMLIDIAEIECVQPDATADTLPDHGLDLTGPLTQHADGWDQQNISRRQCA